MSLKLTVSSILPRTPKNSAFRVCLRSPCPASARSVSSSRSSMATLYSKNPFEGFEVLNAYTRLYTPSHASEANSNGPELIIVATWVFAQPKHIAKYIKSHQVEFPNSKILVLQSYVGNMIWVPDRLQAPSFQPAVTAVESYLDSLNGRTPKILLHIFSNGGGHSSTQLSQTYSQSLSKNEKHDRLPISAIVFDSCPGAPSSEMAVKALTMGLPKNFLGQYIGYPATVATVRISGWLHQSGFMELAVAKQWRITNDPNDAFLGKDIPRTYVYSAGDAVIATEDVEEHARIAREKMGVKEGDKDDFVRLVTFEGTQHVNHMSSDPQRYWQHVHETWERSQRQK